MSDLISIGGFWLLDEPVKFLTGPGRCVADAVFHGPGGRYPIAIGHDDREIDLGDNVIEYEIYDFRVGGLAGPILDKPGIHLAQPGGVLADIAHNRLIEINKQRNYSHDSKHQEPAEKPRIAHV